MKKNGDWSQSAKSVVDVIDVTKVYKLSESVETWALRGVSLSVREGEYLAVMGPSGHGKSTLLHIMGLLERPSSGKVLVDGADTSKLSDKELANLRGVKIGFVFQYFNLINRMTVLENIELPLIPRGMPKSERRRLAMEALFKVEGEDWFEKRPNQLSGGQQQRVALARAIVHNPKIIMADEPTGSLDSKTEAEILGLFRKLNKEGKTIVVVTHNKSIAYEAERIVYIKDGKIVDEERRI
ncbi:ABC transporter ATP-binding protein [Candidatus Bathyarchaeota archaeon]|nr:ABC transporter ATP-binding protein [Candidatus Bathyarchaeota archaeon]MBS7628078.1 ABC transporter ATP-binding protein [Candidatus Bathyarchaeota archaeon]